MTRSFFAPLVCAAFVIACDIADNRSVGFDPDTSDAWYARTDTIRSEMGDPPKIQPQIHTFGERDVFGTDSTATTLLQFQCEATRNISAHLMPGGYVDEDAKTVRIRVDSMPAVTLAAIHLNTASEGFIAFEDPNELLEHIRKGKTLRIEFSPRGVADPIARFNIQGAQSHAPQFIEACDILYAPAKRQLEKAAEEYKKQTEQRRQAAREAARKADPCYQRPFKNLTLDQLTTAYAGAEPGSARETQLYNELVCRDENYRTLRQ